MNTKRSPIRDHQTESKLFLNRALFAFLSIVALVGVLFINLYNIQISNHNTYSTRSDGNRIKVVPVSPNRGLIFDVNGKILAENRPVYSLEITPEQVKDMDSMLNELASLLSISNEYIDEFKQELKRSRRFNAVTLKNQLTEEEVAIFSSSQHKFPGVNVKAYLKRYYPYGSALTHVLGYVAKINDRDVERLNREGSLNNYKATRDIGKLGIERYYEELLHGSAGYQEVEVNSSGRIIRTLKYVPPIPGKNLYLTIDIDLQLYANSLITDKRASIIVLNPKDSSIMAMVSTPSYDPNLFVHGISKTEYSKLLNNTNRPLVNRSTLGVYPPASTVKPFIAIAALSEKVITPRTTRNDPGYWRLPNSKTRPYRDWKRWGHGRVNIKQSIEESVDTFFYQIAYDLGIDRLSVWMNKFGFGEATGIDIREESPANMPTREWKVGRYREPWYKGDTIPVGIGQGYWTATPIQIAKATAILINKGKVNPPRLLAAIATDESKIPAVFDAYPPIENVKDNFWNVVLEGMRLANHGSKGTVKAIFENSSYQTGGKSGTAQVFSLKEDEEYQEDTISEHLRDHALYTGFAPFKNPQIIVSVVIENAGSGSANGGPVAKRIFDYLLLKKPATTDKKDTPS